MVRPGSLAIPASAHGRGSREGREKTRDSLSKHAQTRGAASTFGASAPLKELQRKFGFEPERGVAAVEELFGRK
jgi:transketolase